MQLDIGTEMAVPDALEVVVNSDAEDAFGPVLGHHVSVQVCLDFPRDQGPDRFRQFLRLRFFLFHDLAEDPDATVTN